MKQILLLLAAIISLQACNQETQKTDYDRFTGRWSLDVVQVKADSLSPWVPRTDHYKGRNGFIIYDGMGGMGVHHVTEHYDDYSIQGKGGLDSLTPADLRHLANNFVYFGGYTVLPDSAIVEHHIESHINPAAWGSTARRKYRFSGDTLILQPIRDRYPMIRLKWVRVDGEAGI
jgi:hypothetical protein